MKKLALVVIAAMSVMSCKKAEVKPTSTTPTTNNPKTTVLDSTTASSEFYLSAKIDGKTWGGYESEKNSLHFGTSIEKDIDAPNNVLDIAISTELSKIDTTSDTYDYIDYLEVSVKASNLDLHKFNDDDSIFYNLIKTGTQNFASGEADGIRIAYAIKADESEWSTKAGAQTGSSLNIISVIKGSNLSTSYIDVTGTFTCKLYNTLNPSATPKTLTNGMFKVRLIKSND